MRLFLLTLLLATTALAQKPALDHDAYDVWNRLYEHDISPDGQWTFVVAGPEDQDRMLHVVSADGETRYAIPRGYNARFAPDQPALVFKIKAPKDSTLAAQRAGKSGDALPSDSLGILSLTTGEVTKRAGVKAFALPEEAGGVLAYHLAKAEPDTASTDSADAAPKPKTKPKKGAPKKATGTPLVLHSLADGAESRFDDVVSFALSPNGTWLAFAAASADSTADGAFVIRTAGSTLEPLLAGAGDYTHLAFDQQEEQVAFLSNTESFTADAPHFILYHVLLAERPAMALATPETPGVPAGWGPSEHGEVAFSESGERVMFGTAPLPEPKVDDERADSEKANVEVWTWKDPLLMTMQNKRLETERKRTYLAVAMPADGRVVQLADSTVPDVTIPMKGDAEMALGTSNRPYQMEISWDWPGYRDAYAVNVETGQRRLLLEKIQSGIQASPTGAYAAWWDGEAGAWMAVSLVDGDPIDLTADIDVRFDNEEHDWPYRPNPYGSAGWTEDDRFVVYDRFDLWALDPEGASPMLLTEGLGREEGLQFRFVDLDRDEPVLPDDLLLYTFDDATKSAGYYEADSDEVETPERLVFGPYRFGRVKKAKNADQLVYTRESFEEFPNLWTGSDEFEDTERLTDLNPQQADYNWGTVELVEWTSTHGDDLQGMLVKPENFDPAKEYPLMVYYYEKSSDNLHRHWTPEAHRSIINFSFYASRGYLIFIPDIPYRIGYPGESALHAVLSGTMHVVGLGNVDRDRIGMQGHSWGGYQAAYLATRTNLFRAIEAGAPVSNMFSAYGGIRYRTGMSRMFQYERTQSRIGGTMWEMPLRYIENSPIFWADKIETPLLIMHNDEDGAVPFTQGVELFVALRRLEKPSWLINYTGEPHWPTTFPNKRDWAIRMQEFFDHYLMDAPAPSWMTEGVPALKKDEAERARASY